MGLSVNQKNLWLTLREKKEKRLKVEKIEKRKNSSRYVGLGTPSIKEYNMEKQIERLKQNTV